MATAIGIHDITGPLLSLSVDKARLIDFRPDGTGSVKGCGRTWCFGDVDEHWSFVTTRNRVFSSSLSVLMPLESYLKGSM